MCDVYTIYFRLLLSNCLNWKIYCDENSSVHLQPQFIFEFFRIYIPSFHSSREDMNSTLIDLVPSVTTLS